MKNLSILCALLLALLAGISIGYCAQAALLEILYKGNSKFSIFSIIADKLTFGASLSSAIAAIVVIVLLLLDKQDINKLCGFVIILLSIGWIVVTIIYITRKSRDSNIQFKTYFLVRKRIYIL